MTSPMACKKSIPGLIHGMLKAEQIEKLVSMIIDVQPYQEEAGEL
jgi:hypothetical protein